MKKKLQSTDDELVKFFGKLNSPNDVADLLEISYDLLKYHLYISKPEKRYKEFCINKSSGGLRKILAPISALKILQQKLAYVLCLIYQPKVSVHGFIDNRSILTNAKIHIKKNNVLNLDIKDFFPCINFGRVRGLFIAKPYDLPDSVATVLAQICCFDNQLPQGAPTSPIVSNMICSRLDSQLRILARDNRCNYTRYADDITFSTSIKNFPGNLAIILPNGEVEIGTDLEEIIISNGFEINQSKVRLQTKYQRQEVTGLTVNQFPNISRKFVRQIRAMLHDWEINGLDRAQERHYTKFGNKTRSEYKRLPSFSKIVKGKIDFLRMVKGLDDPNYLRFLNKYAQLNPDYEIKLDSIIPSGLKEYNAKIFTEGKTDWRHIKSALSSFKEKGKFLSLNLDFHEVDEDIGDTKLINLCLVHSSCSFYYPKPFIFIFDRDNPKTLKEVCLEEETCHDWENNVYSISILIPPHREEKPNICIELLYMDNDLKIKDASGRRLFLSNEFNIVSGWHKNEDCIWKHPKAKARDQILIIDNDVFDKNNRNIALPKSRFAQYIIDNEVGFESVDFSGFEPLFDQIEKIILLAQNNKSIIPSFH